MEVRGRLEDRRILSRTGEIEMKRLLGGTLVLALASLASAAPQTPTADRNQTDKTASKHSRKKGAGKHVQGKDTTQASGKHSKASNTQNKSGQPVK